jgi:hypothetical protein
VDKLLHVSLLVRDTGLYDLLTAIEPHKVANLEVRAVAPPMLALPSPSRSSRSSRHQNRGRARRAIESAVSVGDNFNPLSIAKANGIKISSVYSELSRMLLRKQIKKITYGTYQRLA